jgi:plasmid stabilization system protein ParE
MVANNLKTKCNGCVKQLPKFVGFFSQHGRCPFYFRPSRKRTNDVPLPAERVTCQGPVGDARRRMLRRMKTKGYALSQRARKKIEQMFGWMKQAGGPRKVRHVRRDVKVFFQRAQKLARLESAIGTHGLGLDAVPPRKAPQQLFRRVSPGVPVSHGDGDVRAQPVPVLHQSVSAVAEQRRRALALPRQPCLGIGRGLMGFVRAFLSAEIHRRIAAAFGGWLVHRLLVGTKLFNEAQDWISVPSTVKWSFELQQPVRRRKPADENTADRVGACSGGKLWKLWQIRCVEGSRSVRCASHRCKLEIPL